RTLHRLVEAGVAVERGHRAEDLRARELRVVPESFEDGRRDEVALLVGPLATGEDVAAVTPRALDRPEDVVEGALVHHRADLDLGIRRVAEPDGGHACEHLVAERVVDSVLHEDPTRRRALLPGRPERAGVRGLDGAVELGRLRND